MDLARRSDDTRGRQSEYDSEDRQDVRGPVERAALAQRGRDQQDADHGLACSRLPDRFAEVEVQRTERETETEVLQRRSEEHEAVRRGERAKEAIRASRQGRVA